MGTHTALLNNSQTFNSFEFRFNCIKASLKNKYHLQLKKLPRTMKT